MAMTKEEKAQHSLVIESTQPLRDGIRRYGWDWPAGISLLQIEGYCFRLLLRPEDAESDYERKLALHLINAGYTAPAHFVRMSTVMFPEYIHHPWADVMLEACCRNPYVGFAGCSHIGKSQFAAMFGIINYLCSPKNTLVLMTSTTIRDAKKRIWGAVQRYWTSIPRGLPGRLISSPSPSIYWVNSEGKAIEDRGIYLIPADSKKAGEGASKVLGMKSPRIFLLADEMSELSQSLVDTAMSNLINNAHFRLVGFANPDSYYDPFGAFVKPKDGWSSINVETDEWETDKGGLGIHLDGYKSPNVLAGEDKWPILSHKTVDNAVKLLTENSPKFWRMYRGWWCPTGRSSTIFNEVDIERFKAAEPPIWADDTKVRIAALDPSFTSGGDRTALILGWFGKTSNDKMTIAFDKHIILHEDVTNKEESRDFQIARQAKTICETEGVLPEHFALDATGAGIPFASIVETTWSRKILRISFGGKASELRTPQAELDKGRTTFANRASELNFVGLEYLRSGQIKGLYPELIRELVAREYADGARTGGKIQVESKTDMKARGLPSPDIADAAIILIALCREKLGMGFDGVSNTKQIGKTERKKLVKKYSALYRSGHYANT